MKTFMVEELQRPDKIIEFIKHQSYKNIYIHIDLDVLDPKYFPFVKCPTPNGVTPQTLIRLIKALKINFTVVGQSLLEATQIKKLSINMIKNIVKALN